METRMKTQSFFGSLIALAIAAGASAQSSPSPAGAMNIVLVHGALIDGSSWRGVFDVLTRDGYRVSVAQPPLTGLEEDVAATRRVIDQIDGPVILVGNSYGGSIITVAGHDPKVKALVYVAALQPDVGETSAEVAPPNKQATNDLRQTKDGFISLDPAKFVPEIGADLPKATADFMARSQMPIQGAAFSAKLTAAAWHDKPSYAIVATEDHELDPVVARRMANRAGSKVIVLKGGHLLFISHPHAVAHVIETAARAVHRNATTMIASPVQAPGLKIH
jgi:pimeloyl-ACP methyl ester carboxylesterase